MRLEVTQHSLGEVDVRLYHSNGHTQHYYSYSAEILALLYDAGMLREVPLQQKSIDLIEQIFTYPDQASLASMVYALSSVSCLTATSFEFIVRSDDPDLLSKAIQKLLNKNILNKDALFFLMEYESKIRMIDSILSLLNQNNYLTPDYFNLLLEHDDLDHLEEGLLRFNVFREKKDEFFKFIMMHREPHLAAESLGEFSDRFAVDDAGGSVAFAEAFLMLKKNRLYIEEHVQIIITESDPVERAKQLVATKNTVIRKIELIAASSSFEEDKQHSLLDWMREYFSWFDAPSGFQKNATAHFDAFYNKFCRINAAWGDEHQRRNPDAFFSQHAMQIILLFECLGNVAFKFLQDQLAYTALPVERAVEHLPETLFGEMIVFLRQYGEKTTTLTQESFEMWKNLLIGIATLQECKKLSIEKYTQCSEGIGMLNEMVNRDLLQMFFVEMGCLPDEIKKIDLAVVLARIPAGQVAPLCAVFFEEDFEGYEKAFKAFLRHCFLGSLSSYLHDVESGDARLALHNRDIHKLLDNAGIDSRRALSYSKGFDFSIANENFKKPPHSFRVAQWDKTRLDTLFLGNAVECCLSVGGSQFQAMLLRMMDDAVIFHVVTDLKTHKPIALLWLYFAKNEKNEMVLVANFTEIKGKYGAKEYLRQSIMDALFCFTGEWYCRDFPGIAHFLVVLIEYGWNAGQVNFPQQYSGRLEKLGGAFLSSGDISSKECQQDRLTVWYYLNSLNGTLFNQYTEAAIPDDRRRLLCADVKAPHSAALFQPGLSVAVQSESGVSVGGLPARSLSSPS